MFLPGCWCSRLLCCASFYRHQVKETAAHSDGLEQQLAQLQTQHALDSHQKGAEGAALSAHFIATHAVDLVLLRLQHLEHLGQQQAQHRALLAGHGSEHAAALGRLHRLHAQENFVPGTTSRHKKSSWTSCARPKGEMKSSTKSWSICSRLSLH